MLQRLLYLFCLGYFWLLFWAPYEVVAQDATASSAEFAEKSSLPRQQQASRWVETAEAHLQQGQWQAAEDRLNQAIAAQHDLLDAYLLRAKAREHQDDWAGAIADYSSAVFLNPELYEARFQRAMAYFTTKRYADARADFQYLLTHPSLETNAVYYRGEEQGGALVTTGLTTIQSGMQLEWLNFVGLTYYYEGEYDKALNFFNEALALNPTDPNTYLNLGLTAETQRDTTRALSYYEKVLAHEPDNNAAFRNLASLARRSNDTALLAQINKEYGQESFEGLFQQGISALGNQDYAAAIDKLTEALAERPNAAEALIQRGFAYEKAEAFAEALRDYSKAIEIDRRAEKAYSNRGNVYFKRERYDLAVADYTRALELNADNAVALHNRAIAYQRLGRLGDACQDWERARALGYTAATRPFLKLCQP